jgi:hypothetical protein
MKFYAMLCVFVLGFASIVAADVDLALVQNSCSDTEVRIDVVATADGRLPEFVAAVDVLLSWETDGLTLVGIETAEAGANWLVADSLPDPDGINEDTEDGEVLLTFLAQPGEPAVAQTNCGTVLATLVFDLSGRDAAIDILDFVGDHGNTQVYPYYSPGEEALGETDGVVADCSNRGIRRANLTKKP